jgi:hypothetical protein
MLVYGDAPGVAATTSTAVGGPPDAALRGVPAAVPAPVRSPGRSVGRPLRAREAERHRFGGTLSVRMGPFDDLGRIGRYAELLASVPGVDAVRVQTFDRRHVVFEVDIVEPTALIAELRGRSIRPLRVLYASDRIIRLTLG